VIVRAERPLAALSRWIAFAERPLAAPCVGFAGEA
jgi:hypothetical protein